VGVSSTVVTGVTMGESPCAASLNAAA
jgi:hypothetical protein